MEQNAHLEWEQCVGPSPEHLSLRERCGGQAAEPSRAQQRPGLPFLAQPGTASCPSQPCLAAAAFPCPPLHAHGGEGCGWTGRQFSPLLRVHPRQGGLADG